MADKWDLPEFAAGQDQAYTWRLTSDPTDITSQTLVLSVRKGFNTPVLFTLTLGGGGLLVTDEAAGEMDVHFASAKTLGLPPGRYVFDLWRMDPGNTRQLTAGTLTLTPPVTEIAP